MYSMQQVSSDAKEEINRYAEKAQMHFIEDTFSVAESRVVMEKVHQEWYHFRFPFPLSFFF